MGKGSTKGKNNSSSRTCFAKDTEGRKGKGGSSHGGAANGELPKELDTLSRELVQLLRHKGLQQLRADGFAPLASVVAALRSKPSSSQVEAVVLLSKRDGIARFELLEDNGEKWIRAREKHSLRSVELSQSKAETEVDTNRSVQQKPRYFEGHAATSVDAARMVGRAIRDFVPSEWGHDDEYLSLKQGDDLILHTDVVEDSGWAFGNTSHASGWFPATIWKQLEPHDESVFVREPITSCNTDNNTTHHLQVDNVSDKSHVDELNAQLKQARAEIQRLQIELSKERSISASLRMSLETATGGNNCLPSENISSSASSSSAKGAQPEVFRSPTPKESTQILQSKSGPASEKQKLQAFLLETLPNIKNEGIKYCILDQNKDAQGRFQWRASVEITELGDTFEGDTCGSKIEAEQSAAFRALRELGGL